MNTVSKIDRPYLIKVICILGFIGVVISAYWIITGSIDQYEPWFTPYISGSVVLTLIFLSGIWGMRKWGANGYTVLAVLNIAILVFTGKEFLSELIVYAVVIFVLLRNYSKMK